MVIPRAPNQAWARTRNPVAVWRVSSGLVGVDFGVGQPGVVVDGGVDVAVADQRVVMAADPTG
jgi:hypothetical protein